MFIDFYLSKEQYTIEVYLSLLLDFILRIVVSSNGTNFV